MSLTLDTGEHTAQIVGQQSWCEDSHIARKSRLKGGCTVENPSPYFAGVSGLIGVICT
jgi:hypothetical protein